MYEGSPRGFFAPLQLTEQLHRFLRFARKSLMCASADEEQETAMPTTVVLRTVSFALFGLQIPKQAAADR